MMRRYAPLFAFMPYGVQLCEARSALQQRRCRYRATKSAMARACLRALLWRHELFRAPARRCAMPVMISRLRFATPPRYADYYWPFVRR